MVNDLLSLKEERRIAVNPLGFYGSFAPFVRCVVVFFVVVGLSKANREI